MHAALLPDLLIELDKSLQHYALKVKSGCGKYQVKLQTGRFNWFGINLWPITFLLGTRSSFIPPLPALTRSETGSKLRKKKEKLQNLPKRISQVGSTNGDNPFGLRQLCVRMNSLLYIWTELENMEKKIKTCLRNVESAQADITNGLQISFELTLAACHEGILQLCETTAYKVIYHDLSHVLWDALYIGDIASSRIDHFIKELDPTLEMISNSVHSRVRNRVITALMKTSFDGYLLVLLAGGPFRAFSLQDSGIIEEDFRSLKDMYLADGDGLPLELVEKASSQVENVLPLFHADTEILIDRFKWLITETYGAAAKSRYPLPPTSGNWNPAEANTILRVLCHRSDETATKFLKRTYNLPKKL